MMPSNEMLAAAEVRHRETEGILWDSRAACGRPTTAAKFPEQAPGRRELGASAPTPATRESSVATDGAAYLHDGSLEGIFTAIHHALRARDLNADIVASPDFQPRLDQLALPAETDMEAALKTRRLVEYCLGGQAYRCIRTASASESPQKGNIIYRFIRHAIATTERSGCFSCAGKASCTRACEVPSGSTILDDVAHPAVFGLMSLYRSVANECHRLEQFVRFERCEGEVWFARCNPNASVVPMLMDWFVPRFNDQRFIIYDENHALSGVYDGARWYLVGGNGITPPPQAAEEQEMQEAWRRFYRSVSVEARYHPELRRAFMPMRLWRNLPEMKPAQNELERWKRSLM